MKGKDKKISCQEDFRQDTVIHKNEEDRKEGLPVFFILSFPDRRRDYFLPAASFFSALFCTAMVTSYMIGVAMKMEA